MATDGTLPSEIVAFVASHGAEGKGIGDLMYLGRVFLVGNLFMYAATVRPDAEDWESRLQTVLDEKRGVWEKQKLPDLMRFRDYFSFMQFARDEQVIVVVCGADPASGQWIGKPGVRCYGGRLPIPTSQKAPHAGLLAADPEDARLSEMLARFDPPLTYAGYVQRLADQGLRVSAARDGFLVMDDLGNRFHDSYRLHSVYGAKDKEIVWMQPRAERLRAALNRSLGADLVLSGPHEQWEFRNDKKVAGPLYGPQAPAIEFGSDQEIDNRLTVSDLAQFFGDGDHPRWTDVFPITPSRSWSTDDGLQRNGDGPRVEAAAGRARAAPPRGARGVQPGDGRARRAAGSPDRDRDRLVE